MSEIDLSVLSRQALTKPKADPGSFCRCVQSWTQQRNAECSKINWQFTTKDARIKLARLYPAIV